MPHLCVLHWPQLRALGAAPQRHTACQRHAAPHRAPPVLALPLASGPQLWDGSRRPNVWPTCLTARTEGQTPSLPVGRLCATWPLYSCHMTRIYIPRVHPHCGTLWHTDRVRTSSRRPGSGAAVRVRSGLHADSRTAYERLATGRLSHCGSAQAENGSTGVSTVHSL